MYMANLQVFLKDEGVSVARKAKRLLTTLEEAFSRVWMTSRHLALVVELFKVGQLIYLEFYFTSYM